MMFEVEVWEWKAVRRGALELPELPDMSKPFVLDGESYRVEAIELGEKLVVIELRKPRRPDV